MQHLTPDSEPQEIDDAFERRLDRALATAPSAVIPAEFAARVAVQAEASESVPLPGFAYARWSMILSALALLVALLILAPRTSTGGVFPIALQWFLCAQFSLIALFAISPWSFGKSRG